MRLPRITRLPLIIAIMALSACATQQGGTLDDPAPMRYVKSAVPGCVYGAGTAGTSSDASTIFNEHVCRDPRTGSAHLMNASATTTPTTAGRVAEAIAGTVPAALIQGGAALAAASVKDAGDLNIYGSSAAAGAISGSNSGASSDARAKRSGGDSKCSSCSLGN